LKDQIEFHQGSSILAFNNMDLGLARWRKII